MESGDNQTIKQRNITNRGLIYQRDNSGDDNIIINENRRDRGDGFALHKNRDAWETWEELLLASAVERHGMSSWEAVASEVQARTTVLPPSSSTPEACRVKYSDIRLRFTDADTGSDEPDAARVPWLEELRKLRVAELKREVQRLDVSILSLQLKVKRLEEEREKSLQSRDYVTQKNEDESKFQKSKKRKIESSDLERSGNGKPADEERSVNESNSTRKKPTNEAVVEPEIDVIQPGPEDPNREGDDSESAASLSKGKTKSGRMRRRGKEIGGTSPRGDEIKPGISKSEPLISGLLELIRTHIHGTVFQNRVQCQVSKAYTELVREHVDLETIEARLEKKSYSSHLAIYRDLLLMFNNAIVFFPKTSTEYSAALKLRLLVSNEMKIRSEKYDSTSAPSIVSDEVMKNRNPGKTATLTTCRRRKPMIGKPSSSFGREIQLLRESKSNSVMLKSEDKPVTGARTTRRTKKATGNAPSVGEKLVDPLVVDKKRRAADFLNRIKPPSPMDSAMKISNNDSGDTIREKAKRVRGKSESRTGSGKRMRSKISPEVEMSSFRGTNGKQATEGVETCSASVLGKRGRSKSSPKNANKRSRR